MSNELNELCKQFLGTKPGNDHLTNLVEWAVVHKGCGRPLTGMSPKNGWCMCITMTKTAPSTTPEPVTSLDPEAKPDPKVITLSRLHDKTFDEIAAILKCNRQDVHNKLQKWMKQHADINKILDTYEAEAAKI